MKISKTHHIRSRGPGKGKPRLNPARGRYGTRHKERTFQTMFLQDKGTGYMRGRVQVLGLGDGTRVVREERIGRILGRASSTRKSPYSNKLERIRYRK